MPAAEPCNSRLPLPFNGGEMGWGAAAQRLGCRRSDGVRVPPGVGGAAAQTAPRYQAYSVGVIRSSKRSRSAARTTR